MAKSVSLWKVKPTSWCRVVMFCFTSSVSKSTMLNMPSSGEAPMMARHSFTTHSSPTQLSGLVVSSFPSSLQAINPPLIRAMGLRSEEHTSELQSRGHLVCRLLLEKKKNCPKCCEKQNLLNLSWLALHY